MDRGDELALLATDRPVVPTAVDELIRVVSPFQLHGRRVTYRIDLSAATSTAAPVN